ncbi:MAG TPA: response regulator [Bacillota bacterium]|nr:response regulator [Bacillota bacterium]
MAEIMIIEDHAMSRQVLTTMFSSLGHRVLEATDGTAALNLVKDSNPDIIISDILLPTIDGIEFARQLRSLPGKECTPIIFYTATCRLPGELSLGQKLGTCTVIPKPSEPQHILDTVNKYLAKGTDQQNKAVVNKSAESSGSLRDGLQLATLADLSFSLISQRNPEQLLNCASRAAGDFLGCNSLLTICLDNGGQRYYWGDKDNSHSVPAEVGEQVMSRLEPVSWGPMADSRGYGLAVPFTTSGCAYGWHCIWDEERFFPFSEKDRELLMTLSAYSALAYENILLIEAQHKKEEHLEGLVKEGTAKLKETKTELLNTQKLESLGVLAGGIAHDFNNALTVIAGHIQVAKILSDDDDLIRTLDLAEDACFGAQELARKLLTFAKGGEPMKKATALEPLLRDTVQFILEETDTCVQFDIAPDLAAADIDSGQIKQVITNLVLNAQQAMPSGGVIFISAENIVIGPDSTLPLQPGAYVCFSVRDTGVGIPEDILQNIFDPYFTTKTFGSGLGLATAFSIVNNHGGVIDVESKEAVGTAFHVYLPASEEQPLADKEAKTIQQADGHILVIEDNRIIAQTLSELLGMHGYKVEWAREGKEGLELYEKRMGQDKFDVVLMDLVIPDGMGGTETIAKLRELDPTVKAIVVSGYSNDPVMANYKDYGFAAAFPKPFKIRDLVEGIQALTNN